MIGYLFMVIDGELMYGCMDVLDYWFWLNWLIWLIGWWLTWLILTEWLFDWLAGWLVGWLTGWLVIMLMYDDDVRGYCMFMMMIVGMIEDSYV